MTLFFNGIEDGTAAQGHSDLTFKKMNQLRERGSELHSSQPVRWFFIVEQKDGLMYVFTYVICKGYVDPEIYLCELYIYVVTDDIFVGMIILQYAL